MKVNPAIYTSLASVSLTATLASLASSNAFAASLSVTKLDGLVGGTPAQTAVYRADLSAIDFDIRSIQILSNGSILDAGASGAFSGFDLDSILISDTLISNALDINTIPSLNVFDFTSTGTFFTPGTQRPPADLKLFGTDATGNNVDNSVATLGSFDANSTTGSTANGFVSLGDNGKVVFDLNTLVPSNSELFLYIGEVGDNGEANTGQIIVSSNDGNSSTGSNLEPIADIPSRTDSGSRTSGRFGWNYQYDWEFINQMMQINLDIDLVGDDPGDWVNVWEEGIENIWSNRYDIVDGSFTYPLLFDVNFVDGDADQVVTVHSGTGSVNMRNWYLDRPSGWDNSYHDEIAAHEFGHMLGLYDEYEGGAVNPDISPNIFTNSIMSDLGFTQPRHYEDILQLLITETGRDLSLALAPRPLPFMDDPIPNFGQTEVPPGQPVPEPNATPGLILFGLLMYCVKFMFSDKKIDNFLPNNLRINS